MEQQNFENHTQSDPKIMTTSGIWLLSTLSVITLIVSNFTSRSVNDYFNEEILLFVILFGFVVLPFLGLRITRSYSTKLQDRIIRQEVQFRHFVMTNSLIDPRITIKQMIALRFAGDEEFLELCNKTAEQNLDPKTIKSMIKHWKGDFDRV